MNKAILVSDTCPACEVVIKLLEQKGILSEYQIININSPEGKELVSKLEITAIPDCVFISKDKDGAPIARRCTEEEIAEILKKPTGA